MARAAEREERRERTHPEVDPLEAPEAAVPDVSAVVPAVVATSSAPVAAAAPPVAAPVVRPATADVPLVVVELDEPPSMPCE